MLLCCGCGGGGELDELAIGFGLDQAVDVAVASVVPDVLRGDVHGEGMGGLFVVVEGVGTFVAAAAVVATYEAGPSD